MNRVIRFIKAEWLNLLFLSAILGFAGLCIGLAVESRMSHLDYVAALKSARKSIESNDFTAAEETLLGILADDRRVNRRALYRHERLVKEFVRRSRQAGYEPNIERINLTAHANYEYHYGPSSRRPRWRKAR